MCVSCVHACVCLCMYTCAQARTRVLACICTCAPVYAHVCVRVRACVCTRLRSCVCSCVRAHICVLMHVPICVCVHVWGVAIGFLAFSHSGERTPRSHTTAPSRPCWAVGASGPGRPEPQVLHQDPQNKPTSERTQNRWLGPGVATRSRRCKGPSREPLSIR